jgi:hypothetical protein
VKEADILDIVRNSIGSVWALELLLVVGGRPERAWQTDELVRELRSSPAAVAGAAVLLERAGLIARDGGSLMPPKNRLGAGRHRGILRSAR